MRKLVKARRGQSAVETAIVMPMFVFIILGLLQLGLMHQARLMTKYAAYKAARAGSIHSAKMTVMEGAAMAVLLPFMAQGQNQSELTFHATSGAEFATAWSQVKGNNQTTADGKKWVDVTICGPTTDLFKDNDFDDPTFDQSYAGGAAKWDKASSTRLNVQVTFYYRMPIPFANGILWWITHGEEDRETMRLLRMQTKIKSVGGTVNKQEDGSQTATIDKFKDLANQGKYIMPIRNSWGMRMHSNFFKDEAAFKLPSANWCSIPWERMP